MIKDPEVIKHTLENGLTILLIPFENINSVYVDATSTTGSLLENQNEIGAAHLLEHVVFEKTKNYKNTQQLEKKLKRIGAKSNGNTSMWRVNYWIKTVNSKKNLTIAYEYLAEIIINPTLDSADIDRERKIVIEELHNKKANTYYDFFDEIDRLHYPNNERLGIDVLGTEDSLKHLTKKTLTAFWQRAYTAPNFVLTIVGNIDPKEQLVLIKKYFSNMRSGKRLVTKKPLRTTKSFILAKTDTKLVQPKVRLYYPAFKSLTKDCLATDILVAILGNDTDSRMFKYLRSKRGLTYSCGANNSTNRFWGSVSIGADLNQNNIKPFLKYIKKEIHNLKTFGVNKSELEIEKSKIIAESIYSNDDPEEKSSFFSHKERAGHKLFPADIAKLYNQVTQEDILRVANKIFAHEPQIAVFTNTLTEADIHKMWHGDAKINS